jgi:O-antigen/teichoic acid export membrane protein
MSELATENLELADHIGASMAPKGNVHRNFVIYLIGQLLTWTVTFISVSVIPRILGEANSGKLVVAAAATGLPVRLLLLGIDGHIMTEIGRDIRNAPRLLGGLLGLRIALIPAAFVGTLITGYMMHATRLDWLLIAFMLPASTSSFFTLAFRAAFTGHEKAKQVSGSDLAVASSSLLAIPFLSYGPVAIVSVGTAVSLLSLYVQWIWIRKITDARPLMNITLWKQLVRGGAPFCVNSYLVTIYGFISVFMVRRLVGDAGVGVTGQVSKLFGTFMFIPTAMTSALLPTLARAAHADPMAFNRTKLRVLSLLVVLGLPVTVLLWVLAPQLCQLLYTKHKFVEMPLALQITSIAIIPMYVVSSMYQFLIAQGRAQTWTRFLLTTIIVYAITSYAAIPWATSAWNNGPAGASIAMTVAETSSCIAALWLLRVNLLDRDLCGRIARAIFAAACMAATIVFVRHLVHRIMPSDNGISLAAQVMLSGGGGVVVFGMLAWSLKVMWPQDKAKLAEMFSRLTMRMRRTA